ncbi:MAG: hypothetical protein ABIV92_02790, partial [Thermoflexales bacterium]
RSAEDILAYLEENFELAPEAAAAPNEIGDETRKPDLFEKPLDSPSGDSLGALAAGLENESTEDPGDDTSAGLLEPIVDDPEEGEPNDTAKTGLAHTASQNRLVDRFARGLGYVKLSGGQYLHANGSRIEKGHESVFPWEWLTATGETLCYFRVHDHCLETKPLEVAADVWHILENAPSSHALILSDPQGRPVFRSGVQLVAMRDSHAVTLYPASYRIAYTGSR